jgi:hypothetical protein
MMDGPRNPHVKADGSFIPHTPLIKVLNPKIPRPPVDKHPDREEYDAALRILVHLAMIFSGIITCAIMTMFGVDIYMMIMAQGMIPGAVQEFGDFELHL